MATILQFPSNKAGRGRIEALVRKALESHAPETRDRKLEAVMEIYDRVNSKDPVSVTFNNPPGEPFTPQQCEAIAEGLNPVVDSFRAKLREAALEIILLKIAVIDLENR